MSKPHKPQAILEVGTNELEIMEFTLGGRSFGINVAKVLEIMQIQEITPVPQSNPFIEGVFKPRDNIITVINLAAYLGLEGSPNPERDILIVTNFNMTYLAFHVHSVEIIHRVSWASMEVPDQAIYSGAAGVATGITRIGDKLITILDFEKIMAELSPEHSIRLSDLDGMAPRVKNNKAIYIVEDSIFLLELIQECLTMAGYSNLTVFPNGNEAWKALEKIKESGTPILNEVACLITDIEMPQMDGHTLTKLIKQDAHLKSLPVIIFSSLINESMHRKGESVGANAQVSKPNIRTLVNYVDSWVEQKPVL